MPFRFILTLAQILLMTPVDLSAISVEGVTKAQLFGALNVIEEGIVVVASIHGEIKVIYFFSSIMFVVHKYARS